jgi:uncharacterized protein (DUF488 family)
MSQTRSCDHQQPTTESVTVRNTVFTIGHSTHPQGHFIDLLQRHGITALCDVRSTPYSRVNPQFNREELRDSLQACGIRYVFLGKELGARSEDPACYEHGKVRYDHLAQTELFRHGLERVQKGTKQFRLALMCAEKEPLECHRAILIARHLEAIGLTVQHIQADGQLESHTEALRRLIHQLNLPEGDMFRTHTDVIADAYRLQEERIAYNRDDGRDAEVPPIRSAAG